MTSILAKIFGLYFFTIGFAFIINPNSFRRICRAVKHESFLFIGGFLALIIGIIVVTVHNLWIWDWSLLITVLGWWSLFKGFAILTYPECINYFSFILNRSNAMYRMISLFYLALGFFLLYKA